MESVPNRTKNRRTKKRIETNAHRRLLNKYKRVNESAKYIHIYVFFPYSNASLMKNPVRENAIAHTMIHNDYYTVIELRCIESIAQSRFMHLLLLWEPVSFLVSNYSMFGTHNTYHLNLIETFVQFYQWSSFVAMGHWIATSFEKRVNLHDPPSRCKKCLFVTG